MIYRTRLVLLLALFLAGAVDCLLALGVLLLGGNTAAMQSVFLVVFLAVFCVAAVGGTTPLVVLDVMHDIEQGKVGLEERRAKLAPAAPVVVAAPAEPDPDDRGWYLAVEITLLAGQVSGFTDDGLTPIMGSDARPKMQRFLTERGVLALTAKGYAWAEGMTLADALRRLKMGDLAPFPAEPAPEVRAPVHPATRRDTPRRAAKGVERTITGVRAD